MFQYQWCLQYLVRQRSRALKSRQSNIDHSNWGLDLLAVITGPCCSSPCLNDGMCATDGSSYVCKCPQYYTGRNCETGKVANLLNYCLDVEMVENLTAPHSCYFCLVIWCDGSCEIGDSITASSFFLHNIFLSFLGLVWQLGKIQSLAGLIVDCVAT